MAIENTTASSAGVTRKAFVAGSAAACAAALAAGSALAPGGASADEAPAQGEGGEPRVFTGAGQGRGGDIVVKVVLDGSRIQSVEVVKQSETAFIATSALTRVPQLVVANQSLDIDMVAGATYTTVGLLAAIRDALAQAGLSEADLAHDGDQTGLVAEQPIDAPIAIVGGDLAGLSALARVLQDGGRAVLFEETAHVGGSSCVSAGWLTGAGTLLEKAEGIEDSPEQMYQYMVGRVEGNGGTVPFPEIVEAYCMKAGEVMDWLDAYVNVDFNRTGTYGLYVPPDVPRIYTSNGGDRIDKALMETIAPSIQSGDAQIILDAKVTRILKDEAGAVSGLEVSYATGEVRELPFQAVVMCTGGYCSDFDRLDENGLVNFGTGAPSTAGGHGMPVLEDAGCQFVLMQGAGAYPAGLNLGSRDFIYKANTQIPGCIFVSGEGERVGAGGWGSTPDHTVYVVFTGQGRDDGSVRPILHTAYLEPEVTPWRGWEMLDELVQQGDVAFSSDDPSELARQAGIDPDAFSATVETYNGYCEAGSDPDFGKQDLAPLTGTLYMLKTNPYQLQSTGGARISTAAEALDADGAAIPGLFVGGEAAGFGQWSVGGHGGTGLGGAATWGYIAADSAMAYLG